MGLEAILATVIPAFFPALIDGVKMGLSRLFGVNTGDPKSFEDYLRLQDQDIRKLEALAKLDQVYGAIAPWVANLRASSRYLAVLGIIGAAIVYSFLPAGWQVKENQVMLSQLAGSALFFLIGDRVYLGLKHSK